MIQGKKREQAAFETAKLCVGLFTGKVIAVNPTREEYNDVLGIPLKEDSKATDYLGEKDGNTTLRLNIWLLDEKTGFKNPVTFFLEDKIKENKDGTKKQYINNQGVTSWAESENALPDWFKGRDYREARVGEEDLYNFLRTWFGNLDYRDAETVLEMDWKKLMKGNVRDLKDQIDGEYCTLVGCMATVKSVDKDGEVKEYQSIYNGAFFPEYSMKQFRLIDYNTESTQSSLKTKKPKDQKVHEKFVLKIIGEYGCKDFYSFKELKEYDPSENIVSTNEVITTDGSDY